MKKNICIIVLLLCVIGLGGYLSYDKFFKEEKEVEKSDKNLAKDKDTVDERYKAFIDNYKTAINNKKVKIDKSNENDAYENDGYVDNLSIRKTYSCISSKEISDDTNEFTFSNNVCEIGSSYNVILEDGNLTISYDNEELQKIYGRYYLIAKDVWNFEIGFDDVGSFKTLYFIKNDGSVGYAEIEYGVILKNEVGFNSEKFKIVNNYHNLKNIIDIKEASYAGKSHLLATDIDGNVYGLNDDEIE